MMLKKYLKNRRGLSVIIGYLLLVSFAMILSVMVYAWMKSYVPSDNPECPEGVSVYIERVNCTYDGTNYILNLTLKNNGRFKFAGYYIHATNSSEQQIATINLYEKLDDGGVKFGTSILFSQGNSNSLDINKAKITNFVLDSSINSITIIPTRFEQTEGKIKYIGCSKAQIEEEVTCS